MDPTRRKPYPSDLTDAQWELMGIVIPDAKPGGRPRAADMRDDRAGRGPGVRRGRGR
jgi:transposase